MNRSIDNLRCTMVIVHYITIVNPLIIGASKTLKIFSQIVVRVKFRKLSESLVKLELVNPFVPNTLFPYPLKTENRNVFRGKRKGALGTNGLSYQLTGIVENWHYPKLICRTTVLDKNLKVRIPFIFDTFLGEFSLWNFGRFRRLCVGWYARLFE